MTPAARYASAIVILDIVLAGEPAERALTNWARSNRFAGSGDRAAIRDHVYGACCAATGSRQLWYSGPVATHPVR